MKVTKEMKLENFEAWSGGADTLRILKDKGLCDQVEQYIEELELTDETAINDFLWFEDDYIITEILGLNVDEFYN